MGFNQIPNSDLECDTPTHPVGAAWSEKPGMGLQEGGSRGGLPEGRSLGPVQKLESPNAAQEQAVEGRSSLCPGCPGKAEFPGVAAKHWGLISASASPPGQWP